MNFANLGYEAAHAYVAKTPGARWDGWDIILWKRNPRGYKRTDGAFYDGQWGTEKRVSVSSTGKWRLPLK